MTHDEPVKLMIHIYYSYLVELAILGAVLGAILKMASNILLFRQIGFIFFIGQQPIEIMTV